MSPTRAFCPYCFRPGDAPG